MKAIRIHEDGGPEVLSYEEAPDPSPEPGEPTYSPLWAETILTWKAGAKPVLIKSDTQINKIEKTGKLTEKSANVVLNCPIVKVGS